MTLTSAQRRARQHTLTEVIPVLIERTGTVHYGIVDRTLCGVWIGPAQFGDLAVTCGRCLFSYSGKDSK